MADDGGSSPIRMVEVTLAASQWDTWRAFADEVHQRAHRAAVLVAVVVAVALAMAGLLWLPDEARFSIVIYAPVAGAAVWAGLRSVLTRRGLAASVEQVRDVVVPALIDHLEDASVITLLRQGGTLITTRSTMIVEDRRDALVALVASEYDMSSFPAPSFPSGGFGP